VPDLHLLADAVGGGDPGVVHQVGRGVILRAVHPTPQVQPVDLCSDREGGLRCPEPVRPVVHCGVVDPVPVARPRRLLWTWPAVIIGHVDSYKGPGVFFNLGDIRPGQVIDITRADHSVAHFRVDAIDSYPKDLFPTEAVYGSVNYAGLRLITCGGDFDEKTRNYESNTVVYATLIHP